MPHLAYFNGNQLAADVWYNKYRAAGEVTPDDTLKRVAKELARIIEQRPSNVRTKSKMSTYGQKRKPLTEERIYQLLKDFATIIPQGSILASAGVTNINSMSNCVTLEQPHDSYGGICYVDQQLAQLSKRRCGVGVDISTLRPKGLGVTNAALTSTGAVSFMHRYSNTIKEVAQSGRRGALMVTIDCRHPDLLEFIQVKQDLTKVTGANISVRWHDDFIVAAQRNKDYTLRWPVDVAPEEAQVTKVVNAGEVWRAFCKAAHQSAEPGCLFWDKVTRLGPDSPYVTATTTNPCFRGDTLIAVADGRNAVTIKELAEEGLDVPVYSVDPNTGQVTIQWGRNPRVTGYNKRLVRVHLDDGSHVDVTPDHKFPLLDGTVKEAKDLSKGDSLHRYTKVAEKISQNNNSLYNRVSTNTLDSSKDRIFEHRLIAEFFNPATWVAKYDEEKQNGWINGGLVVHHKDYNSLNNRPDNLKIMTFKEHTAYHANHDTQGKLNGRYSGFTDTDLEQAAIMLTKKLNRRFSCSEWQDYADTWGYPKTFSDWRSNGWFDSPTELAEWAAIAVGITPKLAGLSPKNYKTYQRAVRQGYKVKLIDGNVYVIKQCEACGCDFIKEYWRREQSYCGSACATKRINKSLHTKACQAQETMRLQTRAYSDLAFKLNRQPLMVEWEAECKDRGIPFRLKTKYGYQNYKEVVAAGSLYNHKVVKVEELPGLHTVYNITVDHNHTVGVVTDIYENTNGGNNYTGLYITQCGEIPMPQDTCRLVAINLMSMITHPFTNDAYFADRRAYEIFYEAQVIADAVVDLEIEAMSRIIAKVEADPEPYYIKQVELQTWTALRDTAIAHRRTGTGFLALGDMLASLGLKYGDYDTIKFIEKLMEIKMQAEWDASIDLAIVSGPFTGFSWDLEEHHPFIKQLKLVSLETYNRLKLYGRRNISISTVAPTGSISQLAKICDQHGTTSGIEPAYMLAYKRRRKLEDDAATYDYIDDDTGHKWQEYMVYHPGYQIWCAIRGKDPSKIHDNNPYVIAADLTPEQRVQTQATVQRYTTHSISSTINLPASATVEEINEIYMKAWAYDCKGVTVYRDGSRSGVLVATDTKTTTGDNYIEAPKRPKTLPCNIHEVYIYGKRWYVLVGLLDGTPYELFAFRYDKDLPDLPATANITKHAKRHYMLHNGTVLIDNISSLVEDGGLYKYVAEQTMARLISLPLRHGIKPDHVADQIVKVDGTLGSFSSAVSRVLNLYRVDNGKCPMCKSDQLVYKDGCKECTACGYNAC